MKTGYAFGNHIRTEKLRKHHPGEKRRGMRGFIMLFLVCLFSGILLLKLLSIQVVDGSYYRLLSDSNRIRTSIIYAPRGIIFDRNDVPLVYNEPGFRKVDHQKTVLLGRDEAVARIARGEKGIEVDSLRKYPFKDALSHVIGYVGQISGEQLKQSEYQEYDQTDFIGKAGIEQQYESVLRGENGKKLVEVDAMGIPVRTLGQTEPTAGKDIHVTLDSGLQEAVYEAMEGVQKGAAIVSTPEGEILSIVSKPSFDPNLFTMDSSYRVASNSGYTKVSQILLDGVNQPLLNRPISGTYPPGSTFKIVTAAAGLQQKVIKGSFTVQDNGIIRIGPYSFTNWYFTQYGRTEGPVNVVKAISRSNDIFFYKLAEMLRVDRLSKTAGDFGVGHKLGIDLLGEESGVLPTEAWKKQHIGESWYLGDTFIYGIGQGFLLTTPLQVQSWSEVIANGGTLNRPHLLQSLHPEPLKKQLVDTDSIRLIREGMVKACSTGGTAYPLFNFTVENPTLTIDNKDIFAVEKSSVSGKIKFEDARRIQVACKTGTAQHGGEDTLPHAWLTGFAPAQKPEVVVTVLVESGGEGSQVAAPIVKKILTYYFSEKKESD